MTSHKDKLEDMDVSLIKVGVRAVAIIYRNLFTAKPLDMHHFLGYEMNSRYCFGSNGWVMTLVQRLVVFDVFQKITMNSKHKK